MRWLGLCAVVIGLVALAAVLGSRGSGPDEAQAAPWEYGKAMSQRRSYVAASELDGLVYAAGGMVGETGRRLATFQRYDPAADSWTTLPRLPEPVRAAAGVALDGTVYVIGGDDEDGDGTDLWAYDVEAARWTARAPLPAPRFNHGAVALGGRIYVLGGYQDGAERSEVFVYDPATDSWTEGVPLPQPNHAFGTAVVDGEIWAIGGRRGEEILREITIFDPESGAWRDGPELPKAMELLGAAVARDEVHAVWESVYQIYDTATGEWRDGPRSLVTRHGLKTFYVGGALYTIGGCTTALRDSQVVEVRRIV